MGTGGAVGVTCVNIAPIRCLRVRFSPISIFPAPSNGRFWPENVPAALSTPGNPLGPPLRPKSDDSSIKIKRFDPNLFILMELSSFFGLHSRLCGLHRGL